jgi:hypothetical protein
MTRREAAIQNGIAGRAAYTAIRNERIAHYAQIRSWRLTRAQAAARVGVTVRTIGRYEAALRDKA